MTVVDGDTYQAWERLGRIAVQVDAINERLATVERQLEVLIDELRGLRRQVRG